MEMKSPKAALLTVQVLTRLYGSRVVSLPAFSDSLGLNYPGRDDFARIPELMQKTACEYLLLAASASYSAMFKDGGLVQLGATWTDGILDWHSYTYIPPPEAMLSAAALAFAAGAGDAEDLIFLAADMRSPTKIPYLRFDYAPIDAKPGHPASHAHLDHHDARILVEEPLCPSTFLKFVFDHYQAHCSGALAEISSQFPDLKGPSNPVSAEDKTVFLSVYRNSQ